MANSRPINNNNDKSNKNYDILTQIQLEKLLSQFDAKIGKDLKVIALDLLKDSNKYDILKNIFDLLASSKEERIIDIQLELSLSNKNMSYERIEDLISTVAGIFFYCLYKEELFKLNLNSDRLNFLSTSFTPEGLKNFIDFSDVMKRRIQGSNFQNWLTQAKELSLFDKNVLLALNEKLITFDDLLEIPLDYLIKQDAFDWLFSDIGLTALRKGLIKLNDLIKSDKYDELTPKDFSVLLNDLVKKNDPTLYESLKSKQNINNETQSSNRMGFHGNVTDQNLTTQETFTNMHANLFHSSNLANSNSLDPNDNNNNNILQNYPERKQG